MLSLKLDHNVVFDGELIRLSDGKSFFSLKYLDEAIREAIPFGMEVRKKSYYNMERNFPWASANKMNLHFIQAFQRRYKIKMNPTIYDYKWFLNKCKSIKMDARRAECSLGTLGGGNHFIELSISKSNGDLWVTIHSGSRQLGKQICQYWQQVPEAHRKKKSETELKVRIEEIKSKLTGQDIGRAIANARQELNLKRDWPLSLDFLEGEDMYGYLADMIFASVYADENRRIMGETILSILGTQSMATIETVHNFIDFEDFIIRKGAVAARKDQYLVIPFNMEDGILICRGKGNPEWNYSAPHGAGRIMSRSQAKMEFSAELAAERMKEKGIFTSTVPVDEVKEAYKDPAMIEAAIGPTVQIVERLQPILNMKEGKVERSR